ncbi:hypothetical protein CRG98_031260 [Punica granatum]|uniref:Uncharacterized protein n=1 Tax=Punica granatum TaxID=22663 RepID=A0A2I0IWB6_PUNGR|nr:hypothetical protein CRG98_031260 [Punica granatum]
MQLGFPRHNVEETSSEVLFLSTDALLAVGLNPARDRLLHLWRSLTRQLWKEAAIIYGGGAFDSGRGGAYGSGGGNFGVSGGGGGWQ